MFDAEVRVIVRSDKHASIEPANADWGKHVLIVFSLSRSLISIYPPLLNQQNSVLVIINSCTTIRVAASHANLPFVVLHFRSHLSYAMVNVLSGDGSDAERISDERASIVSSAKMHFSIFQAVSSALSVYLQDDDIVQASTLPERNRSSTRRDLRDDKRDKRHYSGSFCRQDPTKI